MGAICCRVATENQPTPTKDNQSAPKQKPFPEVATNRKEIQPTPKAPTQQTGNELIDQIGLENIRKFMDEDADELGYQGYRQDSAKLFDGPLPALKGNYRLWVTLKDSEDKKSNVQHCLQQCEWVFTPAYHYLFEAQEALTKFGQNDDSLENYRIVRTGATKDLLVVVIRFQSKKILVISPRQFLIVRVLQKQPNGAIRSCTRSVQLTDLAKLEPYKTMMGEAEVNAVVHNGTSGFVDNDGSFVINSFSKTDLLSSTGLKIMTQILKKKFSGFFDKLSVEMLRFLFAKSDESDFVWFEGAREEVAQIMKENRERVLKLNIDWKGLGIDREGESSGGNKQAEVAKQAEGLKQESKTESAVEAQVGVETQASSVGPNANDNSKKEFSSIVQVDDETARLSELGQLQESQVLESAKTTSSQPTEETKGSEPVQESSESNATEEQKNPPEENKNESEQPKTQNSKKNRKKKN